jgi:tRNA/rRNA methyltransferase
VKNGSKSTQTGVINVPISEPPDLPPVSAPQPDSGDFGPAPLPLELDSAADEPVIVGTTLRVLDLVSAAYTHSVEHAAATLGESHEKSAAANLVRQAVDFCAARICDQQQKYCQGCRLDIEHRGLKSVDDFCRQFASISFRQTPLVLTPGGPRPARTFDSLEQLSRTWNGDENFYLARRVIRRQIKQDEPRPKRMSGGLDAGPMPALILVRPQLAENIGMVARAMANFGLDELRLVAPRDGWPNERARAAASGANFIVDAAHAVPTLKDALADLQWVCATTARQRDLAKPVMTPEQAVAEMGRRIALGQRCGILFGPERTGLETDEVAVADVVVMVPVNPKFASLNLAQATLLFGYEWLKLTQAGTLGRVTTYEQALTPGTRNRGSDPASKEQLIGFFEHLESELERLGFFNPPHKRQTMVRNLRSMFSRMEATEQEIRTLRGIVATLAKGKGQGRKSST